MNRSIPRTVTDTPCSAEAWIREGWVILTWAQKENQPHRKLTLECTLVRQSFHNFHLRPATHRQLTLTGRNRNRFPPTPPKGWLCHFLPFLEVRSSVLSWPGTPCAAATKQAFPGASLRSSHLSLVVGLGTNIVSLWSLIHGKYSPWGNPSWEWWWSVYFVHTVIPLTLSTSCPVALIPPSPPRTGALKDHTLWSAIFWVQGPAQSAGYGLYQGSLSFLTPRSGFVEDSFPTDLEIFIQ